MSVHIDGPVGLRWNQINVQNWQDDQQRVIGLLSRISVTNGGKKEAWPAPILPGGDGDCSPYLLSAIWDFQKFWLARGVFQNIDGVVDPEGHTLFRMNMFADGVSPPDRPLDLRPLVHNDRVPGTFQVTNVWSLSLGEVGQLGAVKVEITESNGKKFEMSGAGAGFGWSVDPEGLAKALGGVTEDAAKLGLKPLLEMLGKGIGFNIGDYFQLLGGSLDQLTKGVLVANPINKYIGRPTYPTRYLITEGGHANFAIYSLGAGLAWGGEAGLMGFGGPAFGPSIFLCPVLGCYGSIGNTAKFGGGIQAMVYFTTSVTDKKTAADMVPIL